MRRVATVIVATIGGIALLASFHTTPGVATRSLARGRLALRPAAAGKPPTGPAATTSPATNAPTPGDPSSTTSPATAQPGTRTIVGPVETNFYGDVQVEVVVRGGELVDVESLKLPSDREYSRQISSIAGPDLRLEALQARSAHIDILTGATYTSVGYAQSLQGALDQAGL